MDHFTSGSCPGREAECDKVYLNPNIANTGFAYLVYLYLVLPPWLTSFAPLHRMLNGWGGRIQNTVEAELAQAQARKAERTPVRLVIGSRTDLAARTWAEHTRVPATRTRAQITRRRRS